MLGDILYRRGFDDILLRCLEWADSQIVISSAHDGICVQDILVDLLQNV